MYELVLCNLYELVLCDLNDLVCMDLYGLVLVLCDLNVISFLCYIISFCTCMI
jgi:hypothetical protein